MAIVHKALRAGTREYFGPQSLTDGQAGVQGLNTAFAFNGDVVDMEEALIGSLHLMLPTGATTAQLIVPSVTSGLGLLFTAATSGTSSVSVTVNAPSGSTSSVSVVSSTITISPSTTATNASILALVNSNSAVTALASASLFGWSVETSPYDSFSEQPTDPAGVDLMAALSNTALIGGSATSAPSGTMQIYGSNLLNTAAQPASSATCSWEHMSAYDITVSGTGPAMGALINIPVRWLQARWAPAGGGSTGMVFGAWMGKGNTH